MQTEPNAKQQIVEKIKNSTNILVTVGRNPSVDALSAALSLSLMLNRLDKHATAVFSGQVPPAINFLEPNKTFENTVDSLRDFIIALDKEKADRLRYKVEDDVVRIFITPYKTIISDKDLKFSQGDFNVELIIALGVEKREDLDMAITAHGRILHDATVVTINADGGQSTLGSSDWSDASASSLCEMLMSLSEALQSGLLDQQIATAVLTGIVSATDRFRNERTSPRVMTMAAQLMAAGANQQLIATKLEEGGPARAPEKQKTSSPDGPTPLAEGTSTKVSSSDDAATEKKKADGSLEITHTPKADASPLPDKATEALVEAETELAESLEKSAAPVAPTLSVDDLKKDLEAAAREVDAASAQPITSSPDTSSNASPDVPPTPANDGIPQITLSHRDWRTDSLGQQPPSFGGTLNATASDAEEEKHREELDRSNHQLLSHDSPRPTTPPPMPEPPVVPEPPVPDPVVAPEPPSFPPPPPTPTLESTDDDILSFEPAPVPTPIPTLADIDEQTRGKEAEDARAAVDAVLSGMPFNPANDPVQSAGAVPALEFNHDDPVPAPVNPLSEPSPNLGSDAPVSSSLPPLPDFSTLPPLPGDETPPPPMVPLGNDTSQVPEIPLQDTPARAPVTDPGQFRIPGQ